MKKLTVLLFTLFFGFGTLYSYSQEVKQKEEKPKKEVSKSADEKKAAKKTSKAAKKQKKTENKGNAYGKDKEVEGKDFGKERSEAESKDKKK